MGFEKYNLTAIMPEFLNAQFKSDFIFVVGAIMLTACVVPMLTLKYRFRGGKTKTQDSGLGSINSAMKVEGKIESLPDFDWETASRRKYRAFKPIFHITMGVQSDTPSDLITIDEDYSNRVVLRRDLVAQHGRIVHGCTPQGEDSVRELYSYLLVEYLPTRFPTLFKLSHDGTVFMNLATKNMFPTNPPQDALDVLRILAETVEEDIFLLKPTPEGHECVAFVCCFPSGWDPSSKLGKNMNQIHLPVPSYEKIGPSMERFFRRLEVGNSVKRVNWAVQTHTDLFNLKGNHMSGNENMKSNEEINVEKTFLRSELQTLSRLPQTHAILFSFKTYLYPIQEIKAEGLGPQFADAIEGLKKGNAPGMWTYKGGIRWGKPVCDYLRST